MPFLDQEEGKVRMCAHQRVTWHKWEDGTLDVRSLICDDCGYSLRHEIKVGRKRRAGRLLSWLRRVLRV
jgi:hypothetical protein